LLIVRVSIDVAQLGINMHYAKYGLWKECASIGKGELCSSLLCWGNHGGSNSCQRISAGFLLLGSSLLTLCTAIYFFMRVYKEEIDLQRYILIVKILVGISCALGLIGVVMGIISTHQVNSSNQIYQIKLTPTMGWTAVFAILALIINIAATIVSMLIQ